MRLLIRILRELGPWFTFSLAMQVTPARLVCPLLAAFIIGQVALGWRDLKGGNPLSWAVLTALALLLLNGLVGAVTWLNSRPHAAALCYVTFAATAAASVVLGQPFSSHRARRRIPREHWGHPLFLRINRAISLCWSSAFAVNAVLVSCSPAGPRVNLVACYTVLTCAALFSDYYPNLAQRRAAAPDPDGSLAS